MYILIVYTNSLYAFKICLKIRFENVCRYASKIKCAQSQGKK